MKKYSIHFLAALFVGIFKAFVLMNLWNWFVTQVFHISEISFLQVLGLSLVIQLFVGDRGYFGEEFRWNLVMTALEYCIPEDKRELLKQELKNIEEDFGAVLAMKIFSQLCGTAAVLGLGFVIHLYVG